MKRCLVVLTLVALPLAVAAQSVWRCGPDGRSYADVPCAEGKALAIDDSRRADTVADARAVAAREQRLARQMTAERLERERQMRVAGNGLGTLSPAAAVTARPKAPEPVAKPKARKRPGAAAGTSRTAGRASRHAPG
jgi:hypothetical protein